MKQKKIIITLAVLAVILIPVFGYADTATLSNPLKNVNSLSDLFYKIAQFVMDFAYVVVAIFLILSGFKFVKAQGKPEELTDAKKTLQYTIIGALLLIGANTIILVIDNIIKSLKS